MILNSRSVLLTAVILAISFAFPIVGHTKGEVLGASELMAAFPGKSGTWSFKNGQETGKVRWFMNGRQTMTSSDPKIVRDSGFWTIENGKWCSQWTKAYNGKKRCGVIQRIGPKLYSIGAFVTKVN
jgi:hypothetical protein